MRRAFLRWAALGAAFFLVAAASVAAAPRGRRSATSLAGKRVVMVVAPRDFQDDEYARPRGILEGMGAQVRVASTARRLAVGMFGRAKVRPDLLLEDVRPEALDAVVFVGGSGAAAYLADGRAHAVARRCLRGGKLVAAICIAPAILARAGLLRGRTATVFPALRHELDRGGAVYTGTLLARSFTEEGRVITGRSPEAAEGFGRLVAWSLATPWKAPSAKAPRFDVGGGLAQKKAETIAPFQDVRFTDLAGVDPSAFPAALATLDFNAQTRWPPLDGVPRRLLPAALLEAAKNPGLGVRSLHRRGITGKGVSVGIIDQPLYLDHPEFRGKIAFYRDFGCGSAASMHGPAVASLLVGRRCGTAPEATLYYAAAPSWTGDALPYARALDWFTALNRVLPQRRRIRVVSVSACPSGPGTPFTRNGEAWDVARERAMASGILVLTCGRPDGFVGPCLLDATRPDDVTRCKAGFAGLPWRDPKPKYTLLVPCAPRTVAEQYAPAECSFQYNGRGGLSWAIPYCAGVLALGWQIDPTLTGKAMIGLLFASSHRAGDRRFLDPPAFIRSVRGGKRR